MKVLERTIAVKFSIMLNNFTKQTFLLFCYEIEMNVINQLINKNRQNTFLSLHAPRMKNWEN